jgi:hypothetical protein
LGRELNALLWQAYGVVSRLNQPELHDDGDLRHPDSFHPESGDPGPVKVESWLSEYEPG